MVAGSASARILPADGEVFLISRMKRAPGCPNAPARLRRVGTALARNASSETPSKRLASSWRFDAAIAPSTPSGSSTAGLDKLLEQLERAARAHAVDRVDRSTA